VLAIGATLHNGLYIHFPLPVGTDVTAVETIGDQTTTLSPLGGNETDLVYELISDTRSLFDSTTAMEPFINTEVNVATATAQPITLTLTFSQPVALDPSQTPYDLYIERVSAPAGHQIHLPQYAGTATMDTTLFNTDDDASVQSGLHFINGNGLPFALAVPDVIAWPQETVSIGLVYEDIVSFGSSGGEYDQDWYSGADATDLAFTAGLGGSSPPGPAAITDLIVCE